MIYFIQAGSHDAPVKIGYSSSRDPEKRRKELQTGNPYRLRVIGVIPEGTVSREQELHYKFRSASLEGEWFDYTPELREFVITQTELPQKAPYRPGPLECR